MYVCIGGLLRCECRLVFANAMSVRHVSGIGRQIILQHRSRGRISGKQGTDGIFQLSCGHIVQRGRVFVFDLSVRHVFGGRRVRLHELRYGQVLGRRGQLLLVVSGR